MASQVTITVGATTGGFAPKATDQQVGKAFNDFYRAFNLGPPGATNQQVLSACAKWFAKFAHEKAQLQYHEDQEPITQSEADDIYGVPEETPAP